MKNKCFFIVYLPILLGLKGVFDLNFVKNAKNQIIQWYNQIILIKKDQDLKVKWFNYRESNISQDQTNTGLKGLFNYGQTLAGRIKPGPSFEQ